MTLTQLRASARRKISFQTTASAKYADADLDANINEWYREVMSWVFAAMGIWEFQGEISTASLVQDQNEYVLPSDMVILNRVEILYPNQTDYVVATRIDDKQVEDEALANGSISGASEGAPLFRVFDNSIFIYPAPSAAVVNGLKVEIVEDITELSSGSDVPNLNPLMHKILATGAAYEYCSTNGHDRKADRLSRRVFGRFEGDSSGLKAQLEMLVSSRDRTTKTRIVARRKSFK
jgi:hypothetical protein